MPEIHVLGERSANVPPVKVNSSKKRKSDNDLPPINPDDVQLPFDLEADWNANQIRSKIRQYINSGEMKVGEFQNKIGVSSTSYSHFMGQNGPSSGMQSNTFWGATEFFKKREIAGVKIPPRKKAKTSDSKSPNSTAKKSKDNDDAHDVSGIHLEGEENDAVPVYDTCDDIRAKINRFLQKPPNHTHASFTRLLASVLPENSGHKPNARQMSAFLNKHGATSGAESPVFYAAYVFFEKMRIKENKPKGKKRSDMEETWGAKGMERMDMGNRKIFAVKGNGGIGKVKAQVDRHGQLKN